MVTLRFFSAPSSLTEEQKYFSLAFQIECFRNAGQLARAARTSVRWKTRADDENEKARL